MINTKIIKLLRTLDQYEIRQFRDFVHSPLFNKNKNVTKLFDELKKFYPSFDNPELTNEHIFEKVFQSEKFDYFKLKIAISNLFRLSTEFLSYCKYKNDEIAKEKYLLHELRVRNLENIFEQTYKAGIKKNESAKVKDENYILHKFNLICENIDYLAPREPNMNIHLQQEKLDTYLKYFFVRLLKIYDIMLHEEKQNNFKYKMNMFEEVINYIQQNKIEDNPVILVYTNIILLEKERKDEYFFKLKSLSEKYNDELNQYDRYMVFLHLNGYCTNVFNIDCRTDLLQEQFELVKKRSRNSVKEIGVIMYPDFLNEIKIAVRANELEWAEDYIRLHKWQLDEQKDSTLNFCYGYINYRRGNLDEALDLFSRTYFPDFILKLQVKILQLQIYFEKGYYEQAVSMIDNFRHYLKREKTIKENFKESFYEFLTNVNNLIKLKSGDFARDQKYYIGKIKKDIEKMPNNQFGIKLWLGKICES